MCVNAIAWLLLLVGSYCFFALAVVGRSPWDLPFIFMIIMTIAFVRSTVRAVMSSSRMKRLLEESSRVEQPHSPLLLLSAIILQIVLIPIYYYVCWLTLYAAQYETGWYGGQNYFMVITLLTYNFVTGVSWPLFFVLCWSVYTRTRRAGLLLKWLSLIPVLHGLVTFLGALVVAVIADSA